MKEGIGIGIIVLVFVTIVMGLVMFQTISQTVGTTTTSGVFTNKTVTLKANNTYTDIDGAQKYLSVTLFNSSAVLDTTTNVSVENRPVGDDGLMTMSLRVVGSGYYANKLVNITGTYEPDGYISDGGTKSVTLLIGIIVALCIVVVALTPTLRNGILDMIT
jgi:hypothetical protein